MPDQLETTYDDTCRIVGDLYIAVQKLREVVSGKNREIEALTQELNNLGRKERGNGP